MSVVQEPLAPGRVPGERAMRLDGFTDSARPESPTLSYFIVSTMKQLFYWIFYWVEESTSNMFIL